MPTTFDELGRNFPGGRSGSMNAEAEISLHQKITDEIERNYKMIDLIGKHHSSIFVGIISLIGVIGISAMNNFFSDWIIASNIFVVIILILSLRSLFPKKQNPTSVSVELSEKQKSIRTLFVFNSAGFYQESVFRALGLIIFANFLIVIFFTGNLVTGDFKILQDTISLIVISIPAWFWFALQAISFFILIWFFTSKKRFIMSLFRFGLFCFYNKSMSKEFDEVKYCLIFGIIYLITIFFFAFSIPVTIYQLYDHITNIESILGILIIQGFIYALLCDFFSANTITTECFKNIYILNATLTMAEYDINILNEDIKKVIEDNYHTTRLLIPFKKEEWIFLSNYIFLPNVAYWRDEYEDLLMKYLKNVF